MKELIKKKSIVQIRQQIGQIHWKNFWFLMLMDVHSVNSDQKRTYSLFHSSAYDVSVDVVHLK